MMQDEVVRVDLGLSVHSLASTGKEFRFILSVDGKSL